MIAMCVSLVSPAIGFGVLGSSDSDRKGFARKHVGVCQGAVRRQQEF